MLIIVKGPDQAIQLLFVFYCISLKDYIRNINVN